MDPIEEALAKATAQVDAALAYFDEDIVKAYVELNVAVNHAYSLQKEKGIPGDMIVGGIGGAVATMLRANTDKDRRDYA